MTAFIAYFRVSTDPQGVSGLGLKAQLKDRSRGDDQLDLTDSPAPSVPASS